MTWDEIHLKLLLSTEAMQHLLNEPIAKEMTPYKKRYLVKKFKRRFKDNDEVRLYFQKKQVGLAKAILRGGRKTFEDAYELLDFVFINETKSQLTNAQPQYKNKLKKQGFKTC